MINQIIDSITELNQELLVKIVSVALAASILLVLGLQVVGIFQTNSYQSAAIKPAVTALTSQEAPYSASDITRQHLFGRSQTTPKPCHMHT